MQPVLQIELLGHFRLTYRDQPIVDLSTTRLQSLLAYLALHPVPQSRQHLAFLFWPDSAEAQARTNLRQLLHSLKQALPDADAFVHADAQTLQWRSEAPVRLDVDEFEAALARAAAAEQQSDIPTQRAALEQAAAVYQGDLLPGCYDDWLLPERERLRQALAEVLEHLIGLLERLGELRPALACAERLLRHDPLREETYRALMRLHAAMGDRASVVRVYHTCVAVLQRELAVEPSPATQHAYEQMLKVDAAARPAAPPQPEHTNLPVPLTSFIGRERELADVKQLLASTRLLTFTGPGGTGKTRLALQLATDVRDSFPAGAWLVELAPLADPALVAQTVATTLGVREQPGRPLLEALLDYLRAKRLLLLLDNCEHLIGTCAQLAETLLRAAPGLTVLASSREALGIAGETAYRVPSLPLPDPEQGHDPGVLGQNDCVRLFVDRAAAAYPRFRLTARNAPAIVQICGRLDGIPLALELAAARVMVLPPEEIAARLDDRFRLLTGGSRTALERHQTLQALIDWSHNLLTQPERVLLRRLSVFAGGWSLAAAQAVGADGLGADVLDTLAHLAGKSLVMVDEPAEAAEGRYRLLETIRQYARDKLLEVGEAEPTRDHHLDYYLRFAEAAEPKLRSAEQLEWLDRLETEHDNLRTALAWSLERGQGESALRLAGALFYFWLIRGFFSEGQKGLENALALSERKQGEKVAAGEPHTPTRAETARRAKALYGVGYFHLMALNVKETRTRVEESLHLWRGLGDKWWMAVALELMGLVMSMEPYLQSAIAGLEEGVSLARQVEDPWPLAVCLVRLGDDLKVQGTDIAAARRALEEGVAVARKAGDKAVLSEGLRELGSVRYSEGHLTEAASAIEEALAAARAIGSTFSVVLALMESVSISCLQDNPAKAKGYSRELWALGKDTGSPFVAMSALLAFGFAESFLGEPGRGVRLLAAADTMLRQRGVILTGTGGSPLAKVYRQGLEKAQAQLGSAAFDAAWAEGQQMTVEQAVALATETGE